MQIIIRGPIAGPAVAVPAANARVVGAHDARAQAHSPQVTYGAGAGPVPTTTRN